MDLRDLYIVEIEDQYIRENFRKVKDYTKNVFLFKNLKFFEVNLTTNTTNLRFKHNLGYTPKDLIQTGLYGTGTVTWNYNLFDANFLDLTTASIPANGTLTVRFLAGNIDGEN